MKTRLTALFFISALIAAALPACADGDEGQRPAPEAAPAAEDVADEAGLEPASGGCSYVCSSTGQSFFPRASCVSHCPAPGTCKADVC